MGKATLACIACRRTRSFGLLHGVRKLAQCTSFKFGDKSLAKRGDDGLPISRASQLENTIADLVKTYEL